MDTFLLACVLLSILAHHLLRRLNDGGKPSQPLPPGPRGIPILGSLPLIGGAPHSALAELARRYGPIMYLKLGTSGAVVVSTPSAARAFLKGSVDANFANRPSVASGKQLTYGSQDMVFGNYGPKWKLLRRLSTIHLLSGKAMADWAHVRRSEVGHLVQSMCDSARAGRPVVLPEVLVCATANIIGQITMSRRVFDSQGKESKEFKDMILEMFSGIELFNIGDFIPSIAWMDLQGVQAKNKRIHEKFDRMIARMLAEHAATAEEREGRPDFVDLIRANREWEGETLSDVNIKALIFDMFSAGTDTSSIIIEWAIAELIKNPTILERAQSEMDRVIGRDRRLEESDLPNLSYLQAVCKEALRKHPSTPLSLPHYSFEACEVEGYYIPRNTRLLINIWAIGRDPGSWENPLEFDPERFLSGKAAKIVPQGNDFELIPFGAGRRICVGKQAGLLFVQYIVGMLVHSFDWRLQDGEELSMDELPGLALPKAVPVSALVTPRLAPAAYI